MLERIILMCFAFKISYEARERDIQLNETCRVRNYISYEILWLINSQMQNLKKTKEKDRKKEILNWL